MKKRVLAVLLSAAMVFSFAACGDKDTSTDKKDTDTKTETNDDATDKGDEADAAGDYKIAMITDSGDITDQSFNQTTYEACKEFSDANSVEFTYYKPDGDSKEARNASVDQAVTDGANVIVMPGYLFAGTVVDEAELYPDVKFVVLDCGEGDILEAALGEQYDYNPANWNVKDYYHTENVYIAIYQEELSGYMAGQAAVKLGYKKLGFLGGMSVPAVIRYGYGFVQGANDAAVELGIQDQVSIEYVYGGQFFGDADITAAMDTWYSTNGVEVVFACGGGIFTSAAEAAAKVDAKVIGVDSDQAPVIDGQYGEGMTVTSAMKGLAPTVKTLLTAIVLEDDWDSYAGQIQNLGIVSENVEENYVQLPLESTQWSDSFTEDNYKEIVSKLVSGEIKVSNAIDAMPETEITVNDQGSIK